MRLPPAEVKLVEVGPRDGLQNESAPLDTRVKTDLVNRLSATGLSHVEVSSFVDPKRVPQLADAAKLFSCIDRRPGIVYSALVPNLQGLQRALDVDVGAIAVFAAASETFSQRNTRCSIAESLQRLAPVIEQARQHDLPVRGYISCVLGCPYEGPVEIAAVAHVAERLVAAGCEEISLGDTTGCGTPLAARDLVRTIAQQVPITRLAVHFHDTRGQALANILACLDAGVATIDASVAGLGGCPYAPGASGNVATEDVVYMLHGMGIHTGVDLEALVATGRFISDILQRDNQSRVARAGTGVIHHAT